MNHARVRDLLADYLEGDLDVTIRAELDLHLAECPTCSEEVRSLRGVVGLLRSLPDPEPPAGLAGAVMARVVDGKARPPLLRVSLPRMVGTLAAGFAGAALVMSFWGEPNELVRDIEAPGGQRTAGSRPSPVREPLGARSPARPVVSVRSGRVPLGRQSAFGARVAPSLEVLELSAAPPESEVDRQLDWLRSDPAAFIRRSFPDDLYARNFSRLARRAAMRGEADELAERLMAVQAPQASRLAGRFLLESLAARMHQRQLPID